MNGPVNGQGLEAIAVRRAKMTDAGKVRYRVYRTPTDFIAVIAESALMAVKVAGVDEPFRIVRDLPTEEIALEAERIATQEAIEKVQFSTTPKSRITFQAQLVKGDSAEAKFVPLRLRDLQAKPAQNQRILTAEMMTSMLESRPKPLLTPAPAPVIHKPPVLAQTPEPPVAAASLPIPEPMAPLPPDGNEVLSPEEVAKLLSS